MTFSVTGEALSAHTSPWTPRVATQLAVLAAAAFIYVTAEMLPVGALPAIAADLQVSEGLVATLMASYALVAALTTVALVRLTARWPRRRTLVATLVCLTVSQVISALAPNFAVLAGGRVLCALAHGLMWSVIAPIGARLVPASHAGRATAAVYVGTGLALVVGNPLAAALSEVWGWRPAVAVIAVAAAVVALAAWTMLPPLAPVPGVTNAADGQPGHPRNRRLFILSTVTLIGVTGHFIAFTFIVVIIRDVVGIHGPHLAWLLAAFGVAGLAGMAAMARPLDLWPKTSVLGCLAVLAAALLTLSVLGFDHLSGQPALVLGGLAIVAWGASSTALPPMLQASAMRTSPEDPDGASGRYVAAFQVGIMGGALIGGGVYDHGGAAATVAAAAALIIVSMCGVASSRGVFVVSCPTTEK
ncbi:MFS transporter [Mycolicibacterium fortuitum]|uniref:MFS transporter n=1 Tax=Mycolicibacterium fortuitum TaxID=1766 RepID=UPI0007EC28FF|nr:MFS transporter [Mycolicibacterium fortuitum]MDG5770754.1 MFS transporter [Mycolicibacterium fortuitum]OBB39345.1 MFS transporter [Mycolicibacterium fortuitum]OBB46854.1 MFS transporter [Mycolicibacterium fortuitum]OBB53293.1 MFS transporter [Mycolicibacterium fortuitum]OBF82441.1 MFS transporter [Mycolicibacterium fortuitum]